MTSLPRFSVENPVLVNLLMFSLLVGGAYSGLTLVRSLFPEADPDTIMVTTAYPGATPAEVEKGITLKIEEAIEDVDGIDRIVSTISEGVSAITIELFNDFHDVDQAVNDVKAAIDAIPRDDWPEEALETRVAKLDPRLPVISIAVYGQADEKVRKQFSEDLRDELLRLPEVTDVDIGGTRRDEISVEVTPGKLHEYGLSFLDVAEAIRASNLDLPGGEVKTAGANVAVRTLGERDRGQDLYDFVITSDTAGREVRVRDVATIVDGFEDSDIQGRFQGAPATDVTVYKRPEQDAIRIAALVRAVVAGKTGVPLERGWVDRAKAVLSGHDAVADAYEHAQALPCPPGINVHCHTDLSVYIESRLDLLMRNGLWGLLLVFLSLLVFLNWRVAFWVMMGLLLAILGALISMKMLGISLNLLTMFGMIVVLGMLVDDGIIVAEHVYSKVEQGIEPELAAITGTEEVTGPVICAILTTMVAFFPLRYMEGQMGDWMGVLPVVVVLALSTSLLEALSILPAHLAHNLRPVTRMTKAAVSGAGSWLWELRRFQQDHLHGLLQNAYEVVLRSSARYRYVTFAALVAMLLVAIGLSAGGHVPFVFMQQMDAETVVAKMRMGVGTPVEATDKAARAVEQAAFALPELRSIYVILGIELGDNLVSATAQSHVTQAFLELEPADRRSRTSNEIIEELRARTDQIPGVDKLSFEALHGGPGGKPIQIEISGADPDALLAVAQHLESKLREYKGVFDIVDDSDAGQREVQVELLDSARALGLTTEALALQVRAAFYGYEARKVQRGREDVKIMVRYAPEYRRSIYDIESMYIKSPAPALVPVREVARLSEGSSFATLHRLDQRRTVTVTADVNDAVTNAEEIIDELDDEFPALEAQYPGLQLKFGGQKLETNRSLMSLMRLFVVALLLIYTILAGLFRSYIQPVIVMSVVPFGVIGAVLGHFLMGYPITLLSVIGIVALSGIVVNDSMILVAFINRRREEGAELFEAVVDAGRSRLRPILLTTATTVLGLGPLLLEKSFQARVMIPMAISISAGLIFATVLTLLAVPALYLMVEDGLRLWRRTWSWIMSPWLAPAR